MCVRNDIQIPPELVLLGKTLLNLEPMCRRLDPDMDPVATMKDAAVRLLEEQIRRDVSNERLMALLLELRSLVYDVPLSLRRVLTQLANNELRIGIEVEKADEMRFAIRDVANRITLGVITAANSWDYLTFSSGIWKDRKLSELEASIASNINHLALDNIVFGELITSNVVQK